MGRTFNYMLAFAVVFLMSHSALAKKERGIFQVIKGEVTYLDKKGKEKKARVGKKIKEGETVITGKDSRAKIVYPDGNELNISPESKVLIETYVSKSGGDKPNVSLKILYGKMRSNVKEKYDGKDAQYRVKTPAAVAGVRGTDFLGSYNQANSSSSFVTFSGSVDVGKPDADGNLTNVVNVKPGEQTTATVGRNPTPPAAVPPTQLAKMDKESDTGKALGNSDANGASDGRTPAEEGDSEEDGNEDSSAEGGDDQGQDEGSDEAGEEKAEDSAEADDAGEDKAEDTAESEDAGSEESAEESTAEAEEAGAEEGSGESAEEATAEADEAGAEESGGEEATAKAESDADSGSDGTEAESGAESSADADAADTGSDTADANASAESGDTATADDAGTDAGSADTASADAETATAETRDPASAPPAEGSMLELDSTAGTDGGGSFDLVTTEPPPDFGGALPEPIGVIDTLPDTSVSDITNSVTVPDTVFEETRKANVNVIIVPPSQ